MFVESFLRDLEASKERPKKNPTTTRQEQIQKWIPPPGGFAKINVDAVLRKQGRIGAVAAVYRSEDGTFLGVSSVVRQGIGDP